MKILFIGCVEFSYAALQQLLGLEYIQVCCVVTKAESEINSDFRSLAPLTRENNIPCVFVVGAGHKEIIAAIESYSPDIIYCFGWSHLLPAEIVSMTPRGSVGFHPAALPKNRGRHPIIWALALGLETTASTFFLMDQGADSGDIISQELVGISFEDDARSLYEKITNIALKQITEFTYEICRTGRPSHIPQDASKANYWRKRTRQDGFIDWRMSGLSIYNLVRALTKPYPGAHCRYHDHDVKVWRVFPGPADGNLANIEPGKVVEVRDQNIWVKCGDGLIRIIEHEFAQLPGKGDYL